jgi:hypothetical protein
MLTIESLNSDKPLSVFLAIRFAERAFSIWEKEYPEDSRPRKAIEAAKEWLKNPSGEYSAAHAVIAHSAHEAATHYATVDSASSAAYAASSALSAIYSNAYVPWAADSTSNALETDKETLIHEVILENLDWILQYKIENGQGFAEPELIFGHLTEEQKQSFLFNLDRVA